MAIRNLLRNPGTVATWEDVASASGVKALHEHAMRLAREITAERGRWADLIIARNGMFADERAGSDREMRQREALCKRSMARSASDLSDILRVIFQQALGDWSPSTDECDTGLDAQALAQVAAMYRGTK